MSKKSNAKTIFWTLFIVGYFVTSIITGNWTIYIEYMGGASLWILLCGPIVFIYLVLIKAFFDILKNLK